MGDQLTLLFAGLAAATAVIGVPSAYRQLRQARQAGQVEAIATVWQWFDEERYRPVRGDIHHAHDRGELSPGKLVDPELRDAIQTMATSMDRVGLLLVNGLIEDRYVFDRYCEVIITMWELTSWVLDPIRDAKGGGWRYFGPYSPELANKVARPRPDLAQRLRNRVLGAKLDNLHDRAVAYKATHEPGAVYRSARLDSRSADPQNADEARQV